MMKKDNLEQLEEDAIHSGHSDDYISFTNRCKDQWYDGIFSLDEDSYENRSTHKDEKEDYTDLITSITKDQGLLKLYQAVSFSECSVSPVDFSAVLIIFFELVIFSTTSGFP